ncbi:hypothetical protein [Streptomyces sp. NPDC059564]|uniref:hypothetical protein n=1 Tax=Streptomyces sp. NPDC059564 TaxID=3346865 RepID=UPI003673E9C3
MKIRSSAARRRGLLAVTAVATATLAVTSPAGALEGTDAVGPAPTARAFDANGTPLESTKGILDYCRATPDGCSFQIEQKREFYTAVQSMGNAVINCTKKDITVSRTLTLRSTTTDNLGGEISGGINITGSVTGTGSVAGEASGSGTAAFTTPNTQTGPSATLTGQATGKATGTLTGELGATAAFNGAFRLTYSRAWVDEQSETTQYELTVSPGDALVFGSSHAMQRVRGSLKTKVGEMIRDIVVDGPSTVNRSTFIADTFTVPGTTCQKVRPDGKTGVDATTPPTTRGGSRPLSAATLPEGSRQKGRAVLPAHKAAPAKHKRGAK